MTQHVSLDLLDLAEAVASGSLRADEAERQVRAAFGSGHDAASEKAVRELRDLIVAASAVQSHVHATREAMTAETSDLPDASSSIATILPGQVRAGSARRRSSRGGAGRAPRRTWLLVAATIAVGAGVVGASLVGGGVVAPSPVPTAPVAVATVFPSSEPSPSPNPTAVQPGSGVVAFIRWGYKTSGWLDPGRVWIAGADGSGAHELFPEGSAGQSGVAWSPDGTRLIFSEGGKLYLTDANGSEPQLVNTGCVAPCESDSQAAFSSDGTQIVFERSGASHVVATMDLASGRVTELSSTATVYSERPRWSPDGTQIVFSIGYKAFPTSAPFAAAYVVDTNGQNLRRLSQASLPGRFPEWSPDGSRIVFTSYVTEIVGPANDRHENLYQDVYTVRPDWTDLSRVTTDRISIGATWTPDGRILFGRLSPDEGPGAGSLWTMDADGGNVGLLVTGLTGGTSEPYFGNDAAWQPTS